MKKLSHYIIVLIILSCSNTDKVNNNKFYIEGKSKNISDSTLVLLKSQKANGVMSMDSTYIFNNTFRFKGDIKKPEVFGIYIDSLKGYISFFLENDSIIINVNDDYLSHSVITGSNLNDEYLSFIERTNDINSKTKYLFPLFQKARTENNAKKLTEINHKIEKIHQENLIFKLNYAKENPNSYISAFALSTMLNEKSIPIDTVSSIYNNFSHKVKKGDFAIEILLFIENHNKLNNNTQ